MPREQPLGALVEPDHLALRLAVRGPHEEQGLAAPCWRSDGREATDPADVGADARGEVREVVGDLVGRVLAIHPPVDPGARREDQRAVGGGDPEGADLHRTELRVALPRDAPGDLRVVDPREDPVGPDAEEGTVDARDRVAVDVEVADGEGLGAAPRPRQDPDLGPLRGVVPAHEAVHGGAAEARGVSARDEQRDRRLQGVAVAVRAEGQARQDLGPHVAGSELKVNLPLPVRRIEAQDPGPALPGITPAVVDVAAVLPVADRREESAAVSREMQDLRATPCRCL